MSDTTKEDAIVAEQNAVARELRHALGYEDPEQEPLPVTPALAFRLAEVAAMAEEVKRLRDERDGMSAELTKFDDTLARRLGSYGTAGRAANLAMVRTLRNFLDVVAAEVGVSGETLRCDPASARVLLDERLRDAFKDGQLHEAERMVPVFNDIAEQKDINYRRTERLEAERDAARKDAEERRLTLLAEQERANAASLHHPERLLAEINAERIRRNLSWRELATQLRVAPSTLTRWNHGHLPSIGVFFDAYDWLQAMQTANHDLFESRRTACVKRVQQLRADGVILWPPNGAHQQTPEVMLERLTDPNLTEAVLAVYEAVL